MLGVGFRVWGLGFRVEGVSCRVKGFDRHGISLRRGDPGNAAFQFAPLGQSGSAGKILLPSLPRLVFRKVGEVVSQACFGYHFTAS